MRLVESYVHLGRIGVLVELETTDDFAIRTEEFRALARDLAIHIAALAPVGIEPVRLGDLNPRWAELAAEDEAHEEEPVLLAQAFVRDERMTVAERIERVEDALSVPIRVRRFVRFAVDDE